MVHRLGWMLAVVLLAMLVIAVGILVKDQRERDVRRTREMWGLPQPGKDENWPSRMPPDPPAGAAG